MGSQSLARNHLHAVVRAIVEKVSRKFKESDLRYGASNIRTIPYIRLVGARFKSAAVEVRETSPQLFLSCSAGQ